VGGAQRDFLEIIDPDQQHTLQTLLINDLDTHSMGIMSRRFLWTIISIVSALFVTMPFAYFFTFIPLINATANTGEMSDIWVAASIVSVTFVLIFLFSTVANFWLTAKPAVSAVMIALIVAILLIIFLIGERGTYEKNS